MRLSKWMQENGGASSRSTNKPNLFGALQSCGAELCLQKQRNRVSMEKNKNISIQNLFTHILIITISIILCDSPSDFTS